MSKSKPAIALLAAGFAILLTTALSVAVAAADADKAGKKPHDIDYPDDEAKDQPSPPIKRDAPPPPDSVEGVLALSNGNEVKGLIHLTRDAEMKIFDNEKKKLVTVRLDQLTHIEQKVVEEHMEKEWRWLENANNQKVYTGREYPMRQLDTVLHFKDGRTVTGPLESLIYVSNANGDQRFGLHRSQKGDPGTTLADLLYVKMVDFRPPPKPEKKEPAK